MPFTYTTERDATSPISDVELPFPVPFGNHTTQRPHTCTMASRPAVPIIVGVGDVRNKSFKVEDAVEPAQLMVRAIRNAFSDTGLAEPLQKELLLKADSLRVVPTWTWAYKDLPGSIASGLGIIPRTRVMPDHGGNQPALQCDEAARAIANGESDVAILTGGEALASRESLCKRRRGVELELTPCTVGACQKAGQTPPKGWEEADPSGKSLASLDMSILKESEARPFSVPLDSRLTRRCKAPERDIPWACRFTSTRSTRTAAGPIGSRPTSKTRTSRPACTPISTRSPRGTSFRGTRASRSRAQSLSEPYPRRIA